MQFFVTCPKGLDGLLAEELAEIGFDVLKATPAGVRVEGALATAYRACLASRLANRVIMTLARVPVRDPETARQAAQDQPWEDWWPPGGRFRVHFQGAGCGINHTQYGVQCVKDGIVDRLRQLDGSRPAVDRQDPDLHVHARLHRGMLELGLDLAGESLHRRGYRLDTGPAPLKENLAAALLLRAGWPDIARQGGDLVDPLCGSGTLLIEAALMAMDRAPGLDRASFALERLAGFDRPLWEKLRQEYRQRAEAGARACESRFWGFDQNRQVIAAAWTNIERAGLADRIHVERRSLNAFEAPSSKERGLVITNPPYGERLSDRAELEGLYLELGERLREHLQGWRLAVFTGVPELGHAIGVHSYRQYPFYNGALPARLLLFRLEADQFKPARTPEDLDQLPEPRKHNPERAAMLANRLRKNRKSLKAWLEREGIRCYRLYDADMPEYAIAVDCYEDWVHLQEYQAPRSVDERAARKRLAEAMAVVPEVLDIPPERMVVKQRRRQKGRSQYERQDDMRERLVVSEGPCRFYVNLHDYLDTGLFLDHRPIRRWLREQARGRRFLNLFCYTGAATVHAIQGGAVSSLSLDLSRTYLDWARANLTLNGLASPAHRLERVDCLKWLEQPPEAMFDLIFLDPPTFSNSKRMEGVLDVQRDHGALIEGAMARLAPEGMLIFSTNYRRFALDEQVAKKWRVTDISAKTLDPDFERNRRIHRCWRIEHSRQNGVEF